MDDSVYSSLSHTHVIIILLVVVRTELMLASIHECFPFSQSWKEGRVLIDLGLLSLLGEPPDGTKKASFFFPSSFCSLKGIFTTKESRRAGAITAKVFGKANASIDPWYELSAYQQPCVFFRNYWQRLNHRAYEQLLAEGKLTGKAVLAEWAYPQNNDAAQIATLKAAFSNDANSRLRRSMIKVSQANFPSLLPHPTFMKRES